MDKLEKDVLDKIDDMREEIIAFLQEFDKNTF